MKTRKFDQSYMQEMKDKLEVELLGVISLEKTVSKELKNSASSLLPGVKSVVVVGKEIYKEVISLLRPSKEAGEADPGEILGPHSDYINGRLNRAVHELTHLFKKEGFRSLPLTAQGCPTDQRSLMAIFSYKHAAELAGLGTMGKHSLLITSEFGPRVRLACLLTEAPLEGSPMAQKNYCINCEACIQECPAQALKVPGRDEVYSINKFACRTYRQAGMTCGICMKVCDEALG